MSVPLRLLYTCILTKYFFYFGNYHPHHHHQQLKCSTFLVCHCMIDFQSAFFFFSSSVIIIELEKKADGYGDDMGMIIRILYHK